MPDGADACEICGGAGYLRLARPLGDPQFGRVEACECQREREAERVAARLRRLSNLGPLEDVRLEADELATEPYASACRFADESGEASRWLLLTGAAGSGKTRLCAELANRRLADGRPALYFIAADLLDRLRGAMNASSDDDDLSYALLFEHVRDAAFLILDDLDYVSPTDWAREKVYQLLNHRRNGGLRTVLVAQTGDLSRVGLQSVLWSELETIELGRARRSSRYREFGGMTESVLAQYRFDNFRDVGLGGREDAGNLGKVKANLEEWAKHPTGWLTLAGEVGVGKTHLAAAVTAQRLDAGDHVCFAVVPEMLDALRASYRDDGEASFESIFEWLKSVDLLVLDDLGAHSDTKWATEKLYQLCATRYLQRLPTLFTMNVAPEELDARIASRMMDKQFAELWNVHAPDFRTT